MEQQVFEIGLAFIGGIFSLIFWLLRKKDESQEKQIEAQQKQIELLFKKHDDDAQRLAELELKIAQNHYIKPELDNKFERIEESIRDGLKELSGKFDKLSDILIQRNGHDT